MIHDLIVLLAWGEKPRVIDCNSIAIAVPLAALLLNSAKPRKAATK